MPTNFFSQLYALNLKGNIRMNCHPLDDGSMTVSILLINESVKNKSAGKIPPLILKGNTEELDLLFFESITTPIQKTNTLLCNLNEHEHAIKTVQSANTKSVSGSANKDLKRRKFDDQMKKVNELENQNKIGEAIGQLPDLKSYPEYSEEIKTRLGQLRSKHGTLSLFEQAESGQQESADNQLYRSPGVNHADNRDNNNPDEIDPDEIEPNEADPENDIDPDEDFDDDLDPNR